MEIRVDGWRSGIRFDAAHLIPHHPKCGHLHGHTYALHAVLAGEVAEHGFITDFGDVKDALRDLADDLDHRFLLPTESPDLTFQDVDDQVHLEVGEKAYRFPASDVRKLPIEHTSAEELAAHALATILDDVELPPQVTRLEVGLDETYGKGAWDAADLD